MSDLQARFQAAAAAAQSLKSRPDNDTMLRLYSLYKQATQGDVQGKRPGMFDMVNRAKYDAWAKVKGTAPDQAMESYATLVEQLQARDAGPRGFA
jgi:acyl-CoA-binding protein